MPGLVSSQELLAEIQKLDEVSLTRNLIMPLLDEMGFQTVRYTHGGLDYGKDIVCWKENAFGDREWYAAQEKMGSIDGSAAAVPLCEQFVTSFSRQPTRLS